MKKIYIFGTKFQIKQKRQTANQFVQKSQPNLTLQLPGFSHLSLGACSAQIQLNVVFGEKPKISRSS